MPMGWKTKNRGKLTSDRMLVNTFAEVAKVLGTSHLSGHTFAQVNFTYTVDAEPDELLSKILKLDSRIISHAGIGVPGINIGFSRGEPNNPNVHDSRNTALWDKLTIGGNHEGSQEMKVEAVALLLSKLRPYELGRTPTSLDAQTSGELVAIHTSILEKLEQTNADLAVQTTELQRQLRVDAEALIAEERKKVETWRDEVAFKLVERERALDIRQNELEETKKGVDARSSTFARREDREKLLNEVKFRVQNFGVSETTERKRTAVLLGMNLLIAILFILLILAGIEIQQAHTERNRSLDTISSLSLLAEKQPDKDATVKISTQLAELKTGQPELVWLWLRLSLCAIGLVGSVIYYIRWQDRWASQHAMAEWHLRQFQLDISRANWVIESGLEWKKETGELMPEPMLDRIAHGLFVKENEPAQVLHPADELASALLGNASKLNLKTPVGDIEFNKPGKITKTTELN